jgi:flavin-dependent dehydrogenase
VKLESPLDVLVLGEHPASYLVAALLRHKTKLSVLHCTVPGNEPHDRLVCINPAMFDLHPLLAPLRRKLAMSPIYGLQFLADDGQTRCEHRAKSATACVTRYKTVQDETAAIAADEGVQFATPKQLAIHQPDEKGVDVTIGKVTVRATVLVLCGEIPPEQQVLLGLPDGWGPDVVHRYSFIRCKTAKHVDLGSKPVMPMSLDLRGNLNWAWLIPGEGEFQICVEQPIETVKQSDGMDLLSHWVDVLKRHQILNPKFEFSAAAVQSLHLPFAGALAQEGVANRTVLVGPAGGFYSACAEDIYPNCWSAIYAADVLKKALREPHLQDALNMYRHKWRTTLGDYLRGPQQNLRFLLPLVYRNPIMTTRLAEAILFSKSVVR